MGIAKLILVFIGIQYVTSEDLVTCRDQSSSFRQDGGLCFEIAPWQHQPVELDQHIARVQRLWGINATAERRQQNNYLGSSNSEINRYMDTVIAPFLDTYHRNIQNSFQLFTSKILKRIKEEITLAVKRKQGIYKELNQLAQSLDIPRRHPVFRLTSTCARCLMRGPAAVSRMLLELARTLQSNDAHCDEERRACRTLTSNHVAQIYACTERARASIAKMGKYAEGMISITKKHMQKTVDEIGKSFNQTNTTTATGKTARKHNVDDCLDSLSQAAVRLGYELDLSLTNARRHNEQSCDGLTSCCDKTRKKTKESVEELRDLLFQCVYT